MSGLAGFFESSAEYFMEFGIWGLLAISFMESSFFPIPPDLVLVPLALLNPDMALWYALATTIASVFGGVFGYYIGRKAGRPVLRRFVCAEKVEKIDGMLRRYGGWAVAIAGFTPIPYKVFTIAAGVSGINMGTFILASFLGRGARFFLEGLVIMALGAKAGEFLDKYMEAGTIIITVILALGFLLYKYRGCLNVSRDKGVFSYENED